MGNKRGSGSWSKGYYPLKFPEKYLGSNSFDNTGKPGQVYYRSSYEKRFYTWLDLNQNVKRWGDELVIIPYIFKLDNKQHRYHTDAYAEIKGKDGIIRKFIIEVKPVKQNPLHEDFKPPKPPKRKTSNALNNYKRTLIELERNRCKFAAAIDFCKKRDMIFKIITEENLLL